VQHLRKRAGSWFVICRVCRAALVARYPLEVTKSRRHDWWKVTGLAGRLSRPAIDKDAMIGNVFGASCV
jgi:hypothetical protein